MEPDAVRGDRADAAVIAIGVFIMIPVVAGGLLLLWKAAW